MGGELDRTVRCMTVVTKVGILSADDFQNQNLAGVKYVVEGVVSFFSLNKQAIECAVEAMHRGPLLLVFHCGENYHEYVGKYKGKPILSYEKYVHEKMLTHAVNSIGYGVEGFVPNWEFMNSYGRKIGPRGRLLPQNAIRLYGMGRVRPVVHAVPVQVAVVDSRKRKREITEEVDDDEDDDDDAREPPLKKPMLEKIDWMDID